ncbi:transglycosylase domain-containing protein [Sulfurimonas sp.]|uniref:transglycosylase domain-containing protein n=1 Tax=Sulfurimonas sp. TaxID=2022749 RepID=UPI003D099896
MKLLNNSSIKQKILYVIIASFVVFIIYEVYAVGVAYKNLPTKFSQYNSMSLEDLGLNKERQAILVKVQDPTFYTHSGIEWPSPLTSTTITQSLVKKLFFKKFTKGFKKIEQTLIARFVVTPNIDKDTQLIAFISTAYFGSKDGKEIYGFNEGALAWFHKPLSELSDDEYISLLAMLIAPNKVQPNTPYMQERVQRIQKVLSGECIYNNVSQIDLEQCS